MIRFTLLISLGFLLSACDGSREPEDSVTLKTEEIPLFREWHQLFNERVTTDTGPAGSTDSALSTGPDGARAILEELGGIPFPEGASAIYDAQKSTLMVRNTPENLQKVHKLLDGYFRVPHLTRQLERATNSVDDELGSDKLQDTRGGYLEAHAFVSFGIELLDRQQELKALQETNSPGDSVAIQTLIDEITITENFLQQSREAYRQSLVKQLELCRQWQDLVYGKDGAEASAAGRSDTRPLPK